MRPNCHARAACSRVSVLEAHERLVGHGRHGLVVGLGDVVVPPARGSGDLLGHARGDELVLRVEHEELEAGQRAERLGHGEHLLLESLLLRLVVLVGGLVLVGDAQRLGETHVGAAVAHADNDHVARVAALLRLQPDLHRLVKSVRERRAAAAGHALQAPLGHGDGPRGREEHRGLLPLEGDERDLVAALVGGREEVDGRALGRVHPVERHGAARVHDEDDEAARLAGHALGAHVRLLDVHGLNLARALAPRALVGRRGAHRRVDGKARHLALGQHGLDVAPAVLAEDEVALARPSLLGLHGKLHDVRVEGHALRVEHELLGHHGRGVVLLLRRLLLALGLLLLVLVLLVVLGRRRRRRLLHHLVVGRRLRGLHGGAPGDDGELHGELEVVGNNVLALIHSRGRLGHLHGEDLRAVALHARAHRLLAEVGHLRRRDTHVLEELPGVHEGGLHVLLGLGRVLDDGRRVVGEAVGHLRGLDALLEGKGLRVRGEGHADAVEEVVAQLPLLRVVRGNEDGAARVPHREALALDNHLARADHGEEEVADGLVEEVDVVDVEHAPVRPGEEARLEDRLARLQRLLEVNRPEEAVFEHVERHLAEGHGAHLRLEVRELLARGLQLRGEEGVHLALRPVGVDVVLGALDDADRRHECMRRAGHDGLGRAARAGDDHAADVRVDACEDERRLDVLHAYHRRER
mmetsp:Transcript_5608/g.19034  ORF Transcript_5608/g.19034 Transcript_5608/m.19034 type:complete len:695 (+) Transcript_5608:140-2224(+)